MKDGKPGGRGARAWEDDLTVDREAVEMLADYLRVRELEEQALSFDDPGIHEEYAVALRHLMLKYLELRRVTLHPHLCGAAASMSCTSAMSL